MNGSEMPSAIRLLHRLVWLVWLSLSPADRSLELSTYFTANRCEIQQALNLWKDGAFAAGLAPDSATQHDRDELKANVLLAIAGFSAGSEIPFPSPTQISAGSHEGRQDLIGIINKRYADPSLSLKALSRTLDLSDRHLGRLFQKHFGRSFRHCLTTRRIEEATLLLRDTSFSIKMIASPVGFQDVSHFGRAFKTITGFTPQTFRASIQNTS
jgi:AraC-like DNA-binding protein